ncbi:hydroxyisourate hydrolase [Streptomyces aidingensis]|uniref:5-hydroxyisourate hydrolase n=1 Tax=Streptomyces aidingensis TaxID=910347 RepID=A0A1I1ISY3_9ACTN|nr:hydroxyisourate hydrolase [Streptomyces aidingensis]SFC39336.1 5-hydroxyisourate hydrolase/2-oxo-4-hydroxy-4-carboxy-5-ureidoimidazoline decarboxylase [Streptomyces aidingensis]
MTSAVPAGSPATVSTHVLDTAAGHPARGLAVTLAVRESDTGEWQPHATAVTDTDGRCTGLPPLPPAAGRARLEFATGSHPAGAGFFPRVTVVFAVTPGEHHHVPLLLSPYGYTVYRGS